MMNKILKYCLPLKNILKPRLSIIFTISIILSTILLSSCQKNKHSAQEKTMLPIVTTINPVLGDIKENNQLNGQIIYLNKITIIAPITGYVTLVNTAVGNSVNKGDLIFKIQTNENKALENLNKSKLNEYGQISLHASASGYINSLDVTESGVYITQGTPMATIVKNKDLIVQVNSPYEYSSILSKNKNIQIILPDKNILTAYYYKTIPEVDPMSQTQKTYFKLKEYKLLPENLNVLVNFTTQSKKNSILLPKSAILTNETEDKFWIMKVNKDSLAIEIPVEKGLEENGNIEILKPELNINDKIIIKGAYSLEDSTKVTVE